MSHSPLCNHLNNILQSFSLSQVVTEPTHIQHNGNSSLIDLVLMSAPETLSNCTTVPPLANSDHLGIIIDIHCKPHRILRKRRVIWRYNYADFDLACALLNNLDLRYIFEGNSIETCWTRWKKAFLDIMHVCIPKASLPEKKSLPWMTKQIVQLIRKRNYYFRKYKKYNCTTTYSRYKSLRNKVVTCLRQSKSNYFKNLDPKSNKAFWKTVNLLSKSESAIPSLVSNDSMVTTDKEKVEVLNIHFTKCFNYSVPPLDPDLCHHFTCSANEFPDDFLCSVEEVEHLLASVDPSKASGADLLSAKMLKATATSIAPAITSLFNLSLTQGQLPAEWKLACIMPIPKSQDKSDPANYRPISLLSILSKLLEKHVQSYILETCSPLSPNQWGFSRGKSTTGALLAATHAWHLALDGGNDICCVFLDLSKAFDKVPHITLLDTLADIGINPHVLNWLQDYLCQRSQYVVVNGERSTTSNVISGVPQGSVLGPLLFVIYMDGITQLPFQEGTHLLLYADDILLYHSIKTENDYYILQQDIALLEAWISQRYLQLNPAKCKHTILSRKHLPIQPTLQLRICGAPIEKVSSFKYLGVWLSEDLKWNAHIQQITNKARRQAGLIYRRFYKHSNPQCLKQLYLSFVRPHLEYAAPVWNPHHTSQIASIEKVQKFALRMCYKDWREQYVSLLERSGIQSLADRRKLLDICYLYQLLTGVFNFPDAPLMHRNLDSRLRSFDPQLLCLPFARTTAYMNSFFPRVISFWNSLPSSLHSTSSFSEFKHSVLSYI